MSNSTLGNDPADRLVLLVDHFTRLYGRSPDAASISYYSEALKVDPKSFLEILVENSKAAVPIQVDQLTDGYCGQPIGFIHMMKTAGTSFTSALSSGVGLQPVVRSYGTTESPLNVASLWPFIAGHSHLQSFPDGFRLVSVAREPRVRLLSLYASIHFHTRKEGDFQAADLAENSLQTVLSVSPDEWLIDSAVKELMAAYFLSDDDIAQIAMGQSVGIEQYVRPLAKLDGMAWAEDQFGLVRLIERVTARRVDIPRFNVTARTWDSARPISRDLLEAVAAPDRELIEAAIGLGLLPRRSKKAEDDELIAQASRLGFELV